MHKLKDLTDLLRVDQAARGVVDQALTELMVLAHRYEEALRFYASKANYLDGVPMLLAEDGLLTFEDNGGTARLALGQDIPLRNILVLRAPEETKDEPTNV